MVQCKVLKQLEFIEQRKFDDEDIQADIEFLKVRTVNTRFKGVTILILDCDHVCKVDQLPDSFFGLNLTLINS